MMVSVYAGIGFHIHGPGYGILIDDYEKVVGYKYVFIEIEIFPNSFKILNGRKHVLKPLTTNVPHT